MATYIQGVEDYIPQIQGYQPDFTFYAQALQYRKSRYDAAREQIADVYNSVLNNPMLREEDISKRDEFFKQIDQDIKKISKMDLSLYQNQREANHVFSQLLDDDNIAHDMVFTKKSQEALSEGERLRRMGDNGYWAGMDENIQYAMSKYKEADNEKALNMSAPKYVKRVDIQQEVFDKIKDLNFDVTEESPYVQVGTNSDGSPIMAESNWIIKRKNGALVEPYLQAMFSAEFGTRGDVQEYYTEVAKNQRIHFINQNAERYGSDDAANQAYCDQILGQLDSQWSEAERQQRDLISNKESDIRSLKKSLKKAEENDDARVGDYQQQLDEYIQELNGFKTSHTYSSEQMNKIKNANGDLSPELVDNLLAGIQINSDIASSAQFASMKGAETTVKENPFKMEEMKERFQLSKMREEYKLKTQLEDHKAYLKSLEANQENAMMDDVVPVYGTPGSTESNPDTPGTSVVDDWMDTQGETLRNTGITQAQSVIVDSAMDELTRIAEDESNPNRNAARQLIAKIKTRAITDDEQLKQLTKDAGGDYQKWYQSVKDIAFNSSSLNAYMLDDAYKYIINEGKFLTGTRTKYTDQIGKINTYNKSFDLIWKGSAKGVAAAVGALDEKYQNFARAYLGLKKGQSFDEWDGKFSSFDEYFHIGKDEYGLTRNELNEMWGRSKDDDGSIQNLFGQKFDGLDHRSAYAKDYGVLQGSDSRLGTGSNFEVDNHTRNHHRSDVASIIGYALGNQDSVFYYDYFKETNPESDSEARRTAEQYRAELLNYQEGKGKASKSFSCTFVPIAGGDSRYVGLHIQKTGGNAKDPDKNGVTVVVPRDRVEHINLVNSSDIYWADAELYKFNDPIPLTQLYSPSFKYCNNDQPLRLYYDKSSRQLRVSGTCFVGDNNGNYGFINYDNHSWIDGNGSYMSSKQIINELANEIEKGNYYIEKFGLPKNK